jgi:hypothetical protein
MLMVLFEWPQKMDLRIFGMHDVVTVSSKLALGSIDLGSSGEKCSVKAPWELDNNFLFSIVDL